MTMPDDPIAADLVRGLRERLAVSLGLSHEAWEALRDDGAWGPLRQRELEHWRDSDWCTEPESSPFVRPEPAGPGREAMRQVVADSLALLPGRSS